MTTHKQARRRDSADGRPARTRRPSGARIAMRAKEQLASLTGLSPESVTSLKDNGDGTWTVTVELLELSRIPETDDVLGSYEAEVDSRGEIRGYRRVARYPRSHAFEPGAHA